MMSDSLLSSETLIPKVEQLKDMSAAPGDEVAGGAIEVVTVDDLPKMSLKGWVMVATVQVPRRVYDRFDHLPVHPPPERPYGLGRRVAPSLHVGVRAEDHLFGHEDERVLSLVNTSTVMETRFLMRLDRDKTLARLTSALETAEEETRKAHDLVSEHYTTLQIRDEELREARRERDEHARRAKTESAERARDEEQIRKMELDLAALRLRERKLLAALGTVRAKEILGE